MQAYNNILVNLAGGIHLTVDANLFAHRDSDVDDVAVKTELQVGLGYTWHRKWL